MDVLVLGGSVFLGRAMVHEALAAGHRVTVFNRGVSGAPIEGVEQLTGDRTRAEDLEQVRGRNFDLVIDTCGYVPADVRASAELLAPTCGHYAFVSSINVYPAWPDRADYRAGGLHDAGPDATDAGERSERDSYGWLKSGCERAVLRAFGADRCSILRCGLIVGPDDSATGRLPWWLDRVARGGDVLVPGDPDDDMVLIDSRDIAHYALTMTPGAVEVTGPPGRDTRGDLVAACAAATGSDARLTWVDSDWLAGQDVAAWAELPLWIPPALAPGLFAHRPPVSLRSRPLAETVADTWAWQRTVTDWAPAAMTPGLAAAKEAALLGAWRSR